jgi:transcriptional regulator with GAF, ATPase, and Fis domain
LEVGDIVTKQGGRGVEEWQRLYRHDLGKYLAERNEWRDSTITHTIFIDDKAIPITIQARKLSHGDLLWQYFMRFFLSIILICLALYIVFSNIKNKDGHLCALGFCFLVFWLLSGVRYWRGFFHPYLPNITLSKFLIIEPLFILSSHLVLSVFLHFSLIFPEEREFFKRNRWLAIPIYLLSPLILGVSIYFAGGSLSGRYSATYNLRLWIFSIYLFFALFLLLIGYVTCKSPLQRERSRWVVLSVAIAAGSYLIIWNIPKLIIGRPLVTNFDWLLLPLLLVPIAMTLSIDQYHLFGIQGMVRRRIKALEENILKEKQLASSRDQKIQKLSQEIGQLQSELEKYAKVEFPATTRESHTQALENLQRKHPAIKALREERLIGKSPLWKEVFEEVLLASQGDVPVLITGDSGTGKTDIAWAICLLGDRKDRIFKAISCAQFEHSDPAFALGKLFGIGKGHGLPNVAKEGQKGLLEECDGGTLFLDDLDRLPLSVQDLLLYPLEGKSFEPGIGAGPARKVSAKFIFATNQDLGQLVSAGRFRADVLSRIVTRIHVPPLRERPEDVPLLVEHFTSMASQELKHEISVISPKAMNLLLQYNYAAGNVRELKSELYKAIGRAMLGGDHVLRAGYLSEQFSPSKSDARTASEDLSASTRKDSIPIDLDDSRELAVLRKHHFQIKPSEKEIGYSHKSRTLSNHLRGICIKALWESGFDFEKAARRLAGEDDPALIGKIEGKVNRFYHHIEKSVQGGTENKLFNNLPADYHQAFHAAISHIRAKTSSE